MHSKKMDQSLSQALKEDRVFDRCFAIRALLFTARVVQEHQVEIGAITQLKTTQLAVSDDNHAGSLHFALAKPGYAVSRSDLCPGQRQRLGHDELSNVGETIAHFHQRQSAE